MCSIQYQSGRWILPHNVLQIEQRKKNRIFSKLEIKKKIGFFFEIDRFNRFFFCYPHESFWKLQNLFFVFFFPKTTANYDSKMPTWAPSNKKKPEQIHCVALYACLTVWRYSIIAYTSTRTCLCLSHNGWTVWAVFKFWHAPSSRCYINNKIHRNQMFRYRPISAYSRFEMKFYFGIERDKIHKLSLVPYIIWHACNDFFSFSSLSRTLAEKKNQKKNHFLCACLRNRCTQNEYFGPLTWNVHEN